MEKNRRQQTNRAGNPIKVGASPFNTDEIRVPSQRMLDGDKRAAGPRVPDDVWEIPRLVGNAGERLGDKIG